jgi:hypothetical protein
MSEDDDDDDRDKHVVSAKAALKSEEADLEALGLPPFDEETRQFIIDFGSSAPDVETGDIEPDDAVDYIVACFVRYAQQARITKPAANPEHEQLAVALEDAARGIRATAEPKWDEALVSIEELRRVFAKLAGEKAERDSEARALFDSPATKGELIALDQRLSKMLEDLRADMLLYRMGEP